MNFRESYFGEPMRFSVVADFLRHEARKKYGAIYSANLAGVSRKASPRHSQALEALRNHCRDTAEDEGAEAFLEQASLEEVWLAFHAVSHTCLKKYFHECLASPHYFWAYKALPLSRMRFESAFGPLTPAGGSINFIPAISFLPAEDRSAAFRASSDPMIGLVASDGFVDIRDGNGRLLAYAFDVLDRKIIPSQRVELWVGYTGREVTDEDRRIYHEALGTLFPKAFF